MKIKAFILLVIIISGSLFYYGYFDVLLLHSRQKAAGHMQANGYSSFTQFKVPVTGDAQYKGDEIRINGNLYDVAKRIIVNDTIYLSLYHDTDEQDILTVINNFFKTDDNTVFVASSNGTSIKTVHVIYNPLYYFNKEQFLPGVSFISSRINCEKVCFCSMTFYEILTPPPQLS